MIIPTRYDLWMATLVFAFLQSVIALRFLAEALFSPRPQRSQEWPSVRVFLPVAGAAETLRDNLRRILNQAYPGTVRFVFAVPGRGDPAYRIAASFAENNSRVTVVASERTPVRSSGKAVDLVCAVAAAGPEADIYAFADADVEVPEKWLEELVAPLRDEAVEITTAAMLYRPSSFSVGGVMRLAWTAYGLPFFSWSGSVTGQSWAMRAAQFREMDIAGLWGEVLYEDLAVAAAARSAKKTVRFVHHAIGVTADASSLGEAVAVFTKWIQAYRFYDVRTWTLGIVTTALKIAAFLAAVIPPFDPRAAATILAADAILMTISIAAVRASVPDSFNRPGLPLPEFWAAAMSPFLVLAFAWNYGASMISRDVFWGRRRYHVTGPRSIAVFDRENS
ncbi:MAG: hypothetical protein COB53_03475 [Elusimicrobia bacterium]|nr:MAG: hypothetical protein COB53_03475 [Elusimicrobiota bacterium]